MIKSCNVKAHLTDLEPFKVFMYHCSSVCCITSKSQALFFGALFFPTNSAFGKAKIDYITDTGLKGFTSNINPDRFEWVRRILTQTGLNGFKSNINPDRFEWVHVEY